MNQNSVWKLIFIAVILLVCALYALPNLFGEDPAVQISPGYATSMTVSEELKTQVQDLLKAENLPEGRMELDDKRLLIRFKDTDEQLKVYSALEKKTEDELEGYVVAQNLAPATPGWLAAFNASPMYLGLDLRGGVHFLMEVDMDTAMKKDGERYIQEFRTLMREKKIRYRSVSSLDKGQRLAVSFADAQEREAALKLLKDTFQEFQIESLDEQNTFDLRLSYTEAALKETKSEAVEQNITTLRNRVNELGVAEPVIQRQGEDRIVVQLPGVQDTARAKEILGATATLEFRLVGEAGPNAKEYDRRADIGGGKVWLKRQVIVTGNQINHAATSFDQRSGQPAVVVRLDGKGAKRMNDTTKNNIGKPMAVVFIEYKTESVEVDGETKTKSTPDEEVINVATIRDQFSKSFQITGLDIQEANNLALLLRAGALKAPIRIVEERTIGPSLGKESVHQGFVSIVVGFALVMIFMVVRYRMFGLVADVVLFLNVIIMVALLSLLQATLTLPGIAGILLTVGMAVDANVLIFERIREEVRNGVSPQASIHAGYEKALGTIADSNITTLIAAIVLLSFGTGPVKGFAVTLSLGIATSMFTAIMVSRAIVNHLYGNKRLESLPV